ncbi:MAG: helix-hairpin-helix domain-containing protein [Candidatus Hydrogenedens sp.]
MRVVLSDKEWYYGRYVFIGIVALFAVCGGVGIYYYENRTKDLSQTDNGIVQTKVIPSTNKTKIPAEEENKTEKKEKGIPVNIRLEDSLKNVTPEANPVFPQTQDKPRMIAVGIQGAIQKPGLYWLEEGTRLQELIDKAGGPLETAELRYMNIAAILLDGTTVVVPEKQMVKFDGQRLSARGSSQPIPSFLSSGNAYTVNTGNTNTTQNNSSSSSSISNPTRKENTSVANASGLIDINHASQKELETLPGIGPVLAQAIISYRENQPFQSVDELLQVSGIGPKRFEKIRHLVTVTPP